MIRRLLARKWRWLRECRVERCENPRRSEIVCAQHWAAWRMWIKDSPVQPVDDLARDWSLREWVRTVNEDRRVERP